VLQAVVGLPAHATQFASKRQLGILRLPMEPILTEDQLFVSIGSKFQMGHIFFRAVDLSWQLLVPLGAGEYSMSSEIGYKVIVLSLRIFRRPNTQECFTTTLGIRVQREAPL
jgi:hypothetical protein